MMEDCSKYLKKFYLGAGVFFILVLMRTFPDTITTGIIFIDIILALIIMILSLILMGPYLECGDNNKKPPWQR